MAEPNDPFDLAAAWRRLTEANLRYYSGYAKLTREYVDEVVGSFRATRRAPASGPIGAVAVEERPTAAPPPAPAPPAMALQGRLGSRPVGAFVVENGHNRRIHAPLLASSFKDPGGNELGIPLTFEPDEIDLEPNAQVLVRVTASIEDGLKPGVAYRGDVTVPGLPGTRVGLVVRRETQARKARPK